MIPDFNLGGVLPPFIGGTPGESAANATPYASDIDELVDKFFTSQKRGELLLGLIRYRSTLRKNGVINGFQWIDGSFTEDVERNGRVPKDIDVVTFIYRPNSATDDASWADFVRNNKNTIFDRAYNKSNFDCDTMYVDMNIPPHAVVQQTAYWNGLFSHQRNTFQWKGMLAIPLNHDDSNAASVLHQGGVK